MSHAARSLVTRAVPWGHIPQWKLRGGGGGGCVEQQHRSGSHCVDRGYGYMRQQRRKISSLCSSQYKKSQSQDKFKSVWFYLTTAWQQWSWLIVGPLQFSLDCIVFQKQKLQFHAMMARASMQWFIFQFRLCFARPESNLVASIKSRHSGSAYFYSWIVQWVLGSKFLSPTRICQQAFPKDEPATAFFISSSF